MEYYTELFSLVIPTLLHKLSAQEDWSRAKDSEK